MKTDADWQLQTSEEIIPSCRVLVAPSSKSALRGTAHQSLPSKDHIMTSKLSVLTTDEMSDMESSGGNAELLSDGPSEIPRQQELIAELQSKLSAAEVTHEREVQGRIDALETKHRQESSMQQAQFSSQMQELREQLDQARHNSSVQDHSQMTDAMTHQAGHENVVPELRAELMEAQVREQTLLSQNAEQQERMWQLQEQLMAAGGREQQLERQLQEQQEAVASEQMKMLGMHSQRLQLNSEINARDQDISTLQAQISSLQEQASSLQAQAEGAQGGFQHSFQQLQVQHRMELDSKNSLQAQVDVLYGRIDVLHKRNDQLVSDSQAQHALQARWGEKWLEISLAVSASTNHHQSKYLH